MDKKRLIGEEVPQITKGDIDAWHRGKKDAMKSKLLAATQKASVKRAVAIVKLFAQFGDPHYLALRLDMSVDEIRRILATFGISSIEDARMSLRNGVIAEYDKAATTSQNIEVTERKVEHEEASKRLEEQQRAQATDEKTDLEKDLELAEHRAEAEKRNKEDQLRQIIADGIDPKTGKTSFRIPLGQVVEFKKLIPYGVSQLQRRFGGTARDVVDEVKRLAPEIDTDMLRP